MMNKKLTDAYHNITAPDGLRERIEARVEEELKTGAAKNEKRRSFGWVPQAAVAAAAVLCLVILAGGVGIGSLVNHYRDQKGRDGSIPGVELMQEDGRMLGYSRKEVTVLTGEGEDVNDILEQTAETDRAGAMTAEQPQTGEEICTQDDLHHAVIFRVETVNPVTFSADSQCLSTYDEEKKRWTDCEKELTIKTVGELCVLLPPMGDQEVFYIQVSSAEYSGLIEIVYNMAAGQYEAACRTITGESPDHIGG